MGCQPGWRNWQTRQLEGLVARWALQVQILSRAGAAAAGERGGTQRSAGDAAAPACAALGLRVVNWQAAREVQEPLTE